MIAAVSRRGVLSSGAGLLRTHGPILALMVAWTAFPVIALVVWVGAHGGVLTGANGYDTFDQMQYLAWIRDAGSHVLASNLWRIAPTPHDYLQPMYVVSAGLWRLGLPLPVAYMVFKPVAVVVLFGGCAAYARHLLPESRWMQAAAVLFAVFYLSPVLSSRSGPVTCRWCTASSWCWPPTTPIRRWGCGGSSTWPSPSG
jgi:hypothetical protein